MSPVTHGEGIRSQEEGQQRRRRSEEGGGGDAEAEEHHRCLLSIVHCSGDSCGSWSLRSRTSLALREAARS